MLPSSGTKVSRTSLGASRSSQYETSKTLPSGTITNPVLNDGGRSAEITNCVEERPSTNPEKLICDPVGEVNKACTGIRSETNSLNKSLDSWDERIFLSIRSVFGLPYAMMGAKCMGLEVTKELLNRSSELIV